jgi:phage protein D
MVNDELMPFIEFDIDNNTFYQADAFRVSFAVSALPAERGMDWFSDQQEIFVEIFAGFPADPDKYTPADLQSWVYGRADEIEFDPVARVVHLSGRDLTAQMIDTKTTKKWPNKTASEIATEIAGKYELNPVVTATSYKVGRYYEIDHAHMTNQRSEWDLLCYLAQLEQFNVFVAGRDLHFEPQQDANAEPYVLQWQAEPFAFNGMRMRFFRNLTLAHGAQVTVRSWQQKTSTLIEMKYPEKEQPKAQQYFFNIANLSPEEALKKATALHKEITAHEVNLAAELPADNMLDVRSVIRVEGTGTAYDQLYYPASITRRMSIDHGYTMTVRAKNHSPQTEVQL